MSILKQSGASLAIKAGLDHLEETHPDIADAIIKELQDQRKYLKMIASENYCSLSTQIAMGNWLTDKYSEGYPFHRFYAGCENIDTIEQMAIDAVKELFGADHAYVQPHSGADANMVAFWSILVHRVQHPMLEEMGEKGLDALEAKDYERIRKALVGQKMMGMSLNSGGHLTHGYRHNISAKMMEAVTYDVDKETGLLCYDALEKQVLKEKPLILVAGYSAYPRLINFARMREIADKVGATFMVDMAHFAGLVAGGAMSGEYNPVPYAHVVTSTTHKTLRGPRGGLILCTDEYREVIDKGCPLVLGGPLPQVMAAKAIAFREAMTPEFKDYAKQIILNAQALAEALKRKGVELYTDGTDNHLLVIDVAKSFDLNGRHAENALREARLTCNRNTVPFDVNGPWYTSGVRLGTAALTTLGMKEAEMEQIGEMICSVLRAAAPAIVEKTGKPSKARVTIEQEVLQKAHELVEALLGAHPLYGELEIN